MRVKQWWTAFVLLVIFSLVATACGTAAPATGGAQPAAAANSGAATSKKIELRLWQHQNASFIAANEEKIIFHGKRADGIVKGMLQHSRSSSGVKEPIDVNALADEYLRLAGVPP